MLVIYRHNRGLAGTAHQCTGRPRRTAGGGRGRPHPLFDHAPVVGEVRMPRLRPAVIGFIDRAITPAVVLRIGHGGRFVGDADQPVPGVVGRSVTAGQARRFGNRRHVPGGIISWHGPGGTRRGGNPRDLIRRVGSPALIDSSCQRAIIRLFDWSFLRLVIQPPVTQIEVGTRRLTSPFPHASHDKFPSLCLRI